MLYLTGFAMNVVPVIPKKDDDSKIGRKRGLAILYCPALGIDMTVMMAQKFEELMWDAIKNYFAL